MSAPEGSAPEGLDTHALREPVQRLTGTPRAEPGAWQSAPLGYLRLNPGSGGLYRIWGTGAPGTRPWSLVLKIVRSPAELEEAERALPGALSAEPTHWRYWRREPLVYASGLLDGLVPPLVAPRCYGVAEGPDGAAWLWLEDVGTDEAAWSLDRYGLAARHLGMFQGQYLAGRALPTPPWLARGWLRGWAALGATHAQDHAPTAEAWAQPAVRAAVGHRSLSAAVARLVADTPAWLDLLERLPQTLCHFDFGRANLVARRDAQGRDQTVVVDWASLGPGPAGEDPATLVAGALLRMAVPASTVTQLEDAVFTGYLTGLGEAGWQGNEQQVRLAFCLAAAVHWGWSALLNMLQIATDPGTAAWVEQHLQHSAADALAQWAEMTCYVLDRADEARQLLAHARDVR